MVAIRYHLDERTVRQAIQDRIQRLGHLAPVLENIRERLLDSIQRNFDAGGRPVPWPVSQRAKREGGQTLVRTARLKNSMTGRVQGNSVLVGTNVRYARIHQLGGAIAVPEIHPRQKKALRFFIGGQAVFTRHAAAHSVHMPARPFLVAQDADMAFIKRAISAYIIGNRP